MGAKAAASWVVDDEAGDVVGFVGDDGFGEENGERQIGEGGLGSDAVRGGVGGDAGKLVAGAERGGGSHEGGEGGEDVAFAGGCGLEHGGV